MTCPAIANHKDHEGHEEMPSIYLPQGKRRLQHLCELRALRGEFAGIASVHAAALTARVHPATKDASLTPET
jgi:hypothetical protein